MVAPGGPDEDTWAKMSPLAKKIYWILVIVVFTLIGGTFLYAYLK